MQKKELKQTENILLARKNVLINEVEKRFKKYQETNSGKLTDIADIAASVLNGDMEILVAEDDARELRQIEGALARIKAGHYGICEQCGRPIKKARLKAIPFAALCVSCKEKEERELGTDNTKAEYEWANAMSSTENGDAEDADKRRLRNKKIELEYDDGKN